MIILSIDQIMDREKRDMFFLDLKGISIERQFWLDHGGSQHMANELARDDW